MNKENMLKMIQISTLELSHQIKRTISYTKPKTYDKKKKKKNSKRES